MVTAGTTLFTSLKQPQFTGQFVFRSTEGDPWIFHFCQGHIIYASGGIHPIRRWVRNLAAYCPQFTAPLSEAEELLKTLKTPSGKTGWQYQILCHWAVQRKVTREQMGRLIRSMVLEALFDVLQINIVNYRTQADTFVPTQLAAIEAEQAVTEAEHQWNVWRENKLTGYFPNAAPIIRQPEQLQQRAGNVYQVLSKLLDGQRTLRDLSVQMKRNLMDVTRSLVPYLELGLVELVTIPDLPSPQPLATGATRVPPTPASAQKQAPLIACIDDSPVICQSMQKVITAANYRFVGINDPVRAIAILLAQQPNLIFLDLVMPNANGYEICGQLRKLSICEDTPIVILTGHDGIVDRVRAKLVGATDFLAKPVAASTVLEVIRHHLQKLAS